MVLRIARRELLDLTRDGRFRAAVALIALLVLASLADEWGHAHRIRAEPTTDGRPA